MNICPTSALFRRRDGIVDLNGESCIGCRACMAACPYDQLFIDPNTQHGREVQLLREPDREPAAAGVRERLPDRVPHLRRPGRPDQQGRADRAARSVHGPQAREGHGPEGLLPRRGRSDDAAGDRGAAVHVQGRPGAPAPARRRRSPTRTAQAIRASTTTCRTRRPGASISCCTSLTKGISTGAMFLSALFWLLGDRSPLVELRRSVRLARLRDRHGGRADRRSRAARALLLHPDAAELDVVARARRVPADAPTAPSAGLWILCVARLDTAVTILARAGARRSSIGATGYTGFLFAQGLARDLWQGPHATIDLLVQAAAEGSAAMLIVATVAGGEPDTIRALALTLAFASLAHLAILALEHLLTPSPTIHHELAVRAIRHGVYRQMFWIGALGLGGLAPILLVCLASIVQLLARHCSSPPSLVALAGSLAWELRVGRGGTGGTELVRIGRSGDWTIRMAEFRTHPDPSQWDDYVDFESTSWPKKDRRRYWIIPSICFNCESACGILAYVDKETLDVRKIEGNPVHPGSRGRTCAKGVVTPNQLEDPDRILYPLKRDGRAGQRRVEARVVGRGARRHRRADPQGDSGGPPPRGDVPRRPARRGRLRQSRAAGVGHRRAQQPHERLLVVGAARTFSVDRRGSAVARSREREDDPAAVVAPRSPATTSTRTRSASSKASHAAPSSSSSIRACRTRRPRPTSGCRRSPAPKRRCCSPSRGTSSTTRSTTASSCGAG